MTGSRVRVKPWNRGTWGDPVYAARLRVEAIIDELEADSPSTATLLERGHTKRDIRLARNYLYVRGLLERSLERAPANNPPSDRANT